jgi:hypothetical protein
MKILYVSSVCTPKVLDYIFNSSKIKPGQAVQKFHRLIVEGLAMNDSLCQVEVLSSLPVSPGGHRKIFWNLPNGLWNGIKFRYVPFINLFVLKYIFVLFITFFKVSLWCFFNRNNQKIVICDILNI